MMIVFLFEFFLYGLIKLLFQVNYFESTNAIFQYGGIFASQFLQFAAIFLLKKFRGNKRAFQGEKRFYLLQTTVPLLSALFFVLYPVFDGERSPEDDLRYFIIVLLFAAINCIHYVVFEFYQQAERKNYEQQLLNQVYVHREEYYCRMEQHQKEIRKIRHDLKNQLLAIRADNPEIKNQVNVLLRDIQEQEETLFTKHQGLNLLLNNKYQRAKESSIQCSFEVKVPETIQFEAKDLGSLIGNAIDNAIEACQYCKENRYIALQLIYFNHMLVMTIENSFDGVVRELTTRKQIAYEHGFGTDSMRSVTQKYNGDMSYEFLENCFRLEVSIGEKQSSL